MAFTKASYVGSGEVWLAKRTSGVPGAFRFFGNATKLDFSIETDTIEVKNYVSGQGLWDSTSSIKAVKMSLEGTDFTAENIQLALRGTSSAVTAGAVTGEEHIAHLDTPIFADFIPDTSVAYVVKDEAGTTTYALNTDYTVTLGGIIPLSTGTIVDASTIQLAYTKKAAIDIQTLVAGDEEYEVRFLGFNKMKSDRRYFLKAHIVKFSPTTGLSLISDTAGTMVFEGAVLADNTITDPGLSKFFVEKIEN